MENGRHSFAVGLEKRVLDFIRSRCALSRESLVVLAVSGGADSMCLLHVLHVLSHTLHIRLHVAHLDHMLRGAESRKDAEAVTAYAGALGLPCTVAARDVLASAAASSCSLEETAREVRYSFLREVARHLGAEVVMTGHTRDDAVETVMLHILRGSGVHGLRGLEPVADYPRGPDGEATRGSLRLVRPLLLVSRREARQYCRVLELDSREDASNESLAPLRNRIRHEVLPSLRQINPRFDDALLRLARAAMDDDDSLQQQAEKLWKQIARWSRGVVRIELAGFCAASPAVQTRLVLNAVAWLHGSTRDMSFQHVVAVCALSAKPSDKQVHLPHGIVWRREEAELVAFIRGSEPRLTCRNAPAEPVPLAVPGETRFPGWRVVASYVDRADDVPQDRYVAHVAADRADGPLVVRRRRPGDRFRPLGMPQEKKLQDFMVDARIPAGVRDGVPILTSPSHIVWVVGWRIDDRVKVTGDTQHVLRLEFAPQSE